MRVAGIVAEYDPFHTGHAWHIAQTRQLCREETAVVAVMSGNWVQRGGCAVADKWDRTRRALAGGADLVLELPTVWAVSSAERFARGAVGLLKAAGVVDVLSFGSESGLLDDLGRIAQVLEGDAYRAALHLELDRGLSFAQARHNAAVGVLGRQAQLLRGANDCLAVEYLRAAGEDLPAMAVLRRGAAHDGEEAGEFASASLLRRWIRAGEAERAAPYLTAPWQGEAADLKWCERAILARVRTMTAQDWARLPDSGEAEGLPRRLERAGRGCGSMEEFYALAKTRRYAHARIRRLALWAFLELTAADIPAAPPYLRVLGFNSRGREILKAMKARASLPILTKPAHVRELDETGRRLFQLESRCTDLYGLCFPKVRPAGLEWTTGPVIV